MLEHWEDELWLELRGLFTGKHIYASQCVGAKCVQCFYVQYIGVAVSFMLRACLRSQACSRAQARARTRHALGFEKLKKLSPAGVAQKHVVSELKNALVFSEKQQFSTTALGRVSF